MTAYPLHMHTDGLWFKDAQGRTLLLRGVNLGGDSKFPVMPDGSTYRAEGFYDHQQVSFIGRPFPLEEAHSHFARLKAWGLQVVRFIVTWEALEHAGAGLYDDDYLNYLHALLEVAHQYNLRVIIDPHQDVWSRWTGGDGAPGWTLEAVGMDLTQLHVTGAAITHQEHGDPFPRMIWPTNFYKYAAATMFTLFWASEDFAPRTLIEGESAQSFLQRHYLTAFRRLAETLADLPNVIGYDTFNEPIRGYIELRDLTRDEPFGDVPLGLGVAPSAFQGMLMASGHPQRVRRYEVRPWGIQLAGWVIQNEGEARLWRDGYECVWKANGVWTDEGNNPRVLRPEHFGVLDHTIVDFETRYLKPFFQRYIDTIRQIKPKTMIFIEGVPNTEHPTWDAADSENIAYAGHWYDNLTLFLKYFNKQINIDLALDRFQLVIGAGNVQAMYVRQLSERKAAAHERMGGIPVIIGEFGVPFDMNDKRAYKTGDFTPQINALDMYYSAMEEHLLSCLLWNYTASNTNARGDGWNGEDLSIYSRDQHTNPEDIYSGGRGLAAIIRPYPIATAGEPQFLHFERKTRVFTYTYRPDRTLDAPTVIFVPKLHYPQSYTVEGNVGVSFAPITAEQELHITLQPEFDGDTVTITITPN